jgi:6-pyruvoyltetrahydropterin/6-carboxytetrahydropterin synthase
MSSVTRNFLSQRGKFDAGHRVMHERLKCHNVHGHEYHYELTFAYAEAAAIGYAIDFKEIKRIACQWLDDAFDHAFIANPQDSVMIEACHKLGSRLYLMHLSDQEGFVNPTAENIAKEIFFAVATLLDDGNLRLVRVELHETVNCYVICEGLSAEEAAQLKATPLYAAIERYRSEHGKMEYDERKCP